MAPASGDAPSDPGSLEHRPEERALIAEDAARLLGVAEGRLALRILEGLDPVLLVRGERREGEGRERDVVRALRGQQITVVHSAELAHERDPQLAVVLELLELVGVEDVAEVAGDHGRIVTALGMISCLRTVATGTTSRRGVSVQRSQRPAAEFTRATGKTWHERHRNVC